MAHIFAPDEPGSEDCMDCPLPKGNRVHTLASLSTVQSSPSSPVAAARTASEKTTSAMFERIAVDDRGPLAIVFSQLAIAGEHGMTDDEIMRALPDMPENTVRPRRVELEASGLVCKKVTEGEVHKRQTRSGRSAMVWVLTAAGRRLLAERPHSYA